MFYVKLFSVLSYNVIVMNTDTVFMLFFADKKTFFSFLLQRICTFTRLVIYKKEKILKIQLYLLTEERERLE